MAAGVLSLQNRISSVCSVNVWKTIITNWPILESMQHSNILYTIYYNFNTLRYTQTLYYTSKITKKNR